MSTADLLDLLCSQAHECGAALQWANTGTKIDGKVVYERKRMGRYYNAIRLFNETKHAMFLRAGGSLSPEITNREAFIYIASQKRGTCRTCPAKYGARLHFWTDEVPTEPLPLVMAWQGASVEQIKRVLPMCPLICRRCALKRKAKLSANGNPMLVAYGVDVRSGS